MCGFVGVQVCVYLGLCVSFLCVTMCEHVCRVCVCVSVCVGFVC